MTLEILTSRIWRFERGDGTLISSKIQLLPNGQISGYSHLNESCWGIETGKIVFYHKSGEITTKFDTLNRENGKLILRGNFVDPKGKDREVIHILKEVDSDNSSEEFDRSSSLKLGIELGYE